MNCVACNSKIHLESDYVVGESLGEYWCEKCLKEEINMTAKVFKIEDEGGENTWIKALSEQQAVETFKEFIDYEIVSVIEVQGEDLQNRNILDSQETESTYISLAEVQKDRPIPSIIACSVY